MNAATDAVLPSRPARRRRWPYVLGALGGLLLAAVLVVFDAERQKQWLIPQLSPLVDELALDYVLLTPWSVEVRGLALSAQGANVKLSKLELGFNPLALLMDTLSIWRFHLEGTDVDLTHFVPPPSDEKAAPPFPGVLTAFDNGFALALDDIALAATVRLPTTGVVTAAVRGGGLRPHFPGSLNYHVDARLGEGQHATLDGALLLDQLRAGALRKLVANGKLELQWPGLPATEQVAFSLDVAPEAGSGGARYRAKQAKAAGVRIAPPPESLQLSVSALGKDDAERAKVTVDAVYDGSNGRVAGSLGLVAGNALITPFTGQQPLPEIAETATGTFSFTSSTGNFDLDLANDVALSALGNVLGANPELPTTLHVRSAITLAGHPARIAVTRFEHSIAPNNAVPVLQARISNPLLFEPAHPEALLATPQALGVVEITDLPLPWLNGVLGEIKLLGGSLRAGWEFEVDDQQRLLLTSITPLTTGAFGAQQGLKTLFEQLDLRVTPRLRKSDQSVRVWLEDLALRRNDQQLLGGELAFRQPFAAEEGARADVNLQVDFDALGGLPVLAEKLTGYPLPKGLTGKAEATVRVRPSLLGVEALDLAIKQTAAPELLRIKLEQPFALGLGGASPQLQNPRGPLARIALRELDLAWASPFVPDMTFEGRVASADLVLSGEGGEAMALKASAPLRLRGLAVKQGGKLLLQGVDWSSSPTLRYSPDSLSAKVESLAITAEGKSLIKGQLGFAKGTANNALHADGALAIDLNQLLRQPMLAAALGKRAPGLKLEGSLNFDVNYAEPLVKVEALAFKLATDRKASLALTASPGLELRTTITPQESLSRAVLGSVDLQVRDFSSAVLKEAVALEGLEFAAINADFRLSSDGEKLRADSRAPLRVESIRLMADNKPALQPFAIEAEAAIEALGRACSLNISKLQIQFAGAGSPALDARFTAHLAPDETVPLQMLKLDLNAALPQWLSQPAVMPGHRLQSGALNAHVEVGASRAIDARIGIDGLAGRKALAIQTLELPIKGTVAEDGRSFQFSAPLVAQGKSGASNASIDVSFAPVKDEAELLDVRLNSTVFYLNDLLATVSGIAPESAPPSDAPTPATPAAPSASVALDESRDTKAVWDVLPYGTRLRFNIDKIYYTDYLAFDAVGGELNLRRRRFSLSDFSARFHDSPITLDGGFRFRRDAPEPYALSLNGAVKDFDLQTFASELVPGEKPQVEGLFGVTLEASGEMPNLGQLRNRAFFDIHMQSRDGVFHPLPSSSPLLIGASEVLGVVGEGLSYAPTGGFGAGAVARLVNYISRIDYDLIEIRLRRGSSRRVRLSQFLMQSPTVLMSAEGVVDYVKGKDLLDSPLALTGSLNMRGRGAAILYSMNLMQDERDEFGYYKGPEFLISGTPTAPESNFATIIDQAGKGTVRGGVTRPLSGLIGNFKYRWFGPKDRPRAVLPPVIEEGD